MSYAGLQIDLKADHAKTRKPAIIRVPPIGVIAPRILGPPRASAKTVPLKIAVPIRQAPAGTGGLAARAGKEPDLDQGDAAVHGVTRRGFPQGERLWIELFRQSVSAEGSGDHRKGAHQGAPENPVAHGLPFGRYRAILPWPPPVRVSSLPRFLFSFSSFVFFPFLPSPPPPFFPFFFFFLSLPGMKTNAARLLDTLGISYELREYEVDPEDLRAETVAAKIGLPAEQVFKTLVARGERSGVMMAVVPGDAELDPKALARLSGDRKVDTVALKEVLPLTGYVRGGVTVFGARKDYPVFVDETLELFDLISVSAGIRGTQILIAPESYLRALGERAKLGPIARAKE